MAELNDKLITYGNLSTFYDKLQEQGTIKNVSALPDASENKDKLFRLDNGEKDVYAAKLLSSETTTTNRLPDAQQIDKAYIYIGEIAIYYKGAFTITCSDGVLNWYLWKHNSGNMYASADNAINANGTTPIIGIDVESWSDITESGATTTMTMQEVEEDDTIEANGVVIPATYNAPESAQIGNATLVELLNGENGIYNGQQITFEYNNEQITGYKWTDLDDDTYCMATDKPASEIYFYYDEDNDVYYTDTKLWYISLADMSSEEDNFHGLYITQLNAPDSEQVGNAYINTVDNQHCIYTGEQTSLVIDGVDTSVYTWVDVDNDLTIYSTLQATNIYNVDKDSESVKFYGYDESVYEMTFVDDDLSLISTVKYQRTVVTEEWSWEKVATEQYVDDAIDNIEFPEYVAGEGIAIDSANTISCTVKPIADVSSLPDAEANKDSVLRLNGDEQVYISKATAITPTNALPDSEQIGKAQIWYDGNINKWYYAGSYKINCSDGTLDWYLWNNIEDSGASLVVDTSAEYTVEDYITYNIKGYYLSDITGATVTQTGVTTTLSMSQFLQNAKTLHNLDEVAYPVVLTYNESENNQIGNAYIDTNSVLYIYTGEEITWENKTGYKWIYVNQSTFQPNPNRFIISEDKAEDLMSYDSGDDKVVFIANFYKSTDGGTTITPEDNQFYGAQIIQKNAPDSEQVGNAYIDYDGVQYYYTGEQATINGHTGYKWELSNHNDFIITVGVKAEDFHKTYATLGSGDVKIFRNSTSSEINYGDADDIMIVPYKRTANYQWQRVVTEDEIVTELGIDETTFTGSTLTVDGSQPSIVASGSTTIVWDDLASSIPSGKTVEVSVVLINTGNSALTPTMQGNYQMMGDGNLTIQASELGLYRGRYISALNKWLIEAIYQEVSGIME